MFAAALLHDIGHAPLSHSLEPVFKEIFGLTHHQATEDIVAGRVPLGVEMYKVLRDNNVDIERLIAMISGQDASWNGFFSGPINFDTIEGIIRARSYAKPNSNMLTPNTVTEAVLWRTGKHDCKIVDEFWSYKDQVYRHIINSRTGILADFACQLFMRKNLDALSPEDYFITEKKIFRKLHGLRDLLTSRSFEKKIMRQIDRPISYKMRRFYINSSADFLACEDKNRYQQKKVDCIISLSASDTEEPVRLTQDLFDDNGD